MRKSSKRNSFFSILGVLLVFLSLFMSSLNLSSLNVNTSSSSTDFPLDDFHIQAPKISGRIHIDNNWSAVKASGLCTGNGTFNNPYLIKNLMINGSGNGSCILIENSEEYFIIDNCTVFNSGDNWDDAGIFLYNISKAQIIKNNCSFNSRGILLSGGCDNNTIVENSVNFNNDGIGLGNSFNNTITENDINNNSEIGIFLELCEFNNISGNRVNNNTHYYGIVIHTSDNNDILGNIINESNYGIYLFYSRFNTISENTLLRNNICIDEDYCTGNIFINNGTCSYGQENAISGFNMLLLLIIIIIILQDIGMILLLVIRRQRNHK